MNGAALFLRKATQPADLAGLGQPRRELLIQAGARPRRLTALLAAVTRGVLAWAAAVPAAFATPKPQPLSRGRFVPPGDTGPVAIVR